MLTPEELRLHARKRRRLVLLLVIVLVLGPCIFFAARPTRDAIKGWQARRHAQKAFAMITQQNWNDARIEAIAAYQLRSTEPEALRAIARLLSRMRQPQALEFWEQLSKKQALTREDLRDEAAVAMVAGETERAATTVQSLLERKDAAAAEWLLAAQLDLQKGNREEAQDYLQKILDAPASSAREQLQAAAVRLALETGADAPSAKRRAEAIERLRKLGEGKDEAALDALVILAQQVLAAGTSGAMLSAEAATDPSSESAPTDSPDNQKEKAPVAPAELIRALENHPLAKAPQKLLAVDLKILQSPNDKTSLLDAAISQWKESETDSVAVLARWLNSKGEFQRLLDEIPLDKALVSRELFLQHVDALGALGRWDEIKRLLQSERFPLDPAVQRMYLARCNAQLGEKAAAENNWARAFEAAGNDLQKLLPLADYAEKNGANETAAAAYDAAVAAAPRLRPAQQARLRLAQAAKDTKRLHAILGEMLKLWPDDTAVQNDEAYLRLLLLPNDPASAELVAIEHLAEDLVKREPASLPHRTLLALALLKQGRRVAALEAYANVVTTPGALSPSALAVHAAVLAANDRRDDARQEIQQASLDSLLPEEQAGTADLRD